MTWRKYLFWVGLAVIVSVQILANVALIHFGLKQYVAWAAIPFVAVAFAWGMMVRMRG